jgi:hypothetical protein
MRGNAHGVATAATRRRSRWFPLLRVTGIEAIDRMAFAVMLVGYMHVNGCTHACIRVCTCEDETEVHADWTELELDGRRNCLGEGVRVGVGKLFQDLPNELSRRRML